MKQFLRVLASSIQASIEVGLRLSAKELSNCFNGLQSCDSKEPEVVVVLQALYQLLRNTDTHGFDSRSLGDALFGLQGVRLEDHQVIDQILGTCVCIHILISMSHQFAHTNS